MRRCGQPTCGRSRAADEFGQTSLLMIALAALVAGLIGVVTNASAAYLQRQALNTLADGAALSAVEGGAVSVYPDGIPAGRLPVDQQAARRHAEAHLSDAGAHQRFPDLQMEVEVDAEQGVFVRLRAPLELPLAVPGVEATAQVSGSGRAAVLVRR